MKSMLRQAKARLKNLSNSVVLIVCFTCCAIISTSSNAHANAARIWTYELRGFVGSYPIGANITVLNDNQYLAGHYFYGRYNKNIELSGSIVGNHVVLFEPGGASMDLHFYAAGKDAKSYLDFSTSTALVGTWHQGEVSLPVKLVFTEVFDGYHSGRWYSTVTDQSDMEFEALVSRFLTGVLTGDRNEAESAVSFPLQVWDVKIDSKEELNAKWNSIFTPKYLAILRTAVPHEMVVENGRAMVADGAVWFDGNGAVLLEPP